MNNQANSDSSSLSLRAERVVEEARRLLSEFERWDEDHLRRALHDEGWSLSEAQTLAAAPRIIRALLASQEAEPVDTYTPIAWALLTEDEKYAEYVRVRKLASQEAAPCPDYKPAWDEINRVFDDAAVLLAKEPRSYLGWNWVHALVDALKRRQEGSPR